MVWVWVVSVVGAAWALALVSAALASGWVQA
jgi:hypothetical protein